MSSIRPANSGGHAASSESIRVEVGRFTTTLTVKSQFRLKLLCWEYIRGLVQHFFHHCCQIKQGLVAIS
jgi:hypothetical protein